MELRATYKPLIFITMCAINTIHSNAQFIASMDVDSVACAGDTLSVSIGFGAQNSIVLHGPTGTMSHPGLTFLPDGSMCDSICYYSTSVVLEGFDDSTVITSAQDIKYVRINIEHSFLGDLFFGLECPNGQQIALMKAGHNPNRHDSCGEMVPPNFIEWDHSTSNWQSAFLGLANDNDAHDDPCDSADSLNAPGTGWNYCWSDNGGIGIVYAEGDGLIYRATNSHNAFNPYTNGFVATIDSSNVLQLRQFYHPDIGFDNLAGCPLNGEWTIYITDGWHQDNGWVFDWEIALADHLLNTEVTVDSTSVSGGWQSGDSTWAITIPQGATGDTLVTHSTSIYFSNGRTLDTTFTVHYLPSYYAELRDTLCKGDTARFDGLEFTTNTDQEIHYTSRSGCDSVVALHYRFMPTYHLLDTLYFCRNEAFVYDGVDYGGPVSITNTYQTHYGCDSIVGVRLEMVDSLFLLRLLVSDDSLTWCDDTAFHACRPFTLYLRDTTHLEQWRQWTFGDGDTLTETISQRDATPFAHVYDTLGSFTLTLSAVSIRGCIDTSVVMTAAVNVYPVPIAGFSWEPYHPNQLQANMQFINLSQPFDSLEYQWYIDGDTSTLPSPYYHWDAIADWYPDGSSDDISGDHTVNLAAIWLHPHGTDTLRCVDTATHPVTITELKLGFPSLVTPNDDGQNDRWEIVNLIESGIFKQNELWIYNSWGVEIFHTRDITNITDFWNPKDTHSPDGTYYYRFAAHSPYGSLRRNGTIEVINGK